MHSNLNSLKLLVGDEKLKNDPNILHQTAASFIPQTLRLEEPPEIYDEKKQIFINYDEKYKAKFTAAENLTSNIKFCMESALNLEKESSELKDMIKEHREAMDSMTSMINEKHNKNTELLQTIMKDFYSNLKNQLYGKKNENYQLVRELQQLEREKIQLQQQTVFSKRRIAELETVVGITHVEREHDDEDDYDDNY